MHSRIFKCKHLLASARPQEKGDFKENKIPQGRQAQQLFISQIQGGQHSHHCAAKALAVLNTAVSYLSWLLYLLYFCILAFYLTLFFFSGSGSLLSSFSKLLWEVSYSFFTSTAISKHVKNYKYSLCCKIIGKSSHLQTISEANNEI